MRVVIQRVGSASVAIKNNIISKIGNGLLILLGVEDADSGEDINWLCGKIARLRIFDDQTGVMNKSVMDIGGEVIVVSQFTLHASTKKGNRPSYIRASKPDHAIAMYKKFIKVMSTELNCTVKTGQFGAKMDVTLINNGPVIIIMDSKTKDF